MIGSVGLTGYCDPLSARPGERISFCISAASYDTCQVSLRRIICSDPNPAGPGMVEQSGDRWFTPAAIAIRQQLFLPGSCAVSKSPVGLKNPDGLALQATIWPTLATETDQTILSLGEIALLVDECLRPVITIQGQRFVASKSLTLRNWVTIRGGFDAGSGRLYIEIGGNEGSAVVEFADDIEVGAPGLEEAPLCVAALWNQGEHCDHFNGKIEAPAIICTTANEQHVAAWDFADNISSNTIAALDPSMPDLDLINSPARAVTGSAWDGSEMCWRHKPAHYAAIHFHDDDVYDFDWEEDLGFVVPDDMPSGIYAMQIEAGENRDSIPFFVCPSAESPRARLCVLVPTFTYAIYGNHARPDFSPEWLTRNQQWNAYPNNPAMHQEYGLSTYNNHGDGSGICHASHKRPLFNMRPGYITFGNSDCSGLRHLQADTHLISWLHHEEIEYDIITDRELHHEGVAALAGYSAVMTTSHPEYHTTETLNALLNYTGAGGRLMYLGGNGFYWRIAIHPEQPDLLEIRRAEDGIRAWAAEPGEYYNAFDGAYGGLWRRNGRPPQQLAGVGFSAQGSFTGSYYRRKNFDPAFDWVFEGIEGDVIGDFGLCGNGAAGFELDRIDYQLGSPEQLVLLASSEEHDDGFVLVPEEQLTHITNIPGEPEKNLLRADMVYYELEGGGAVFSVGSITFCGSLPVNEFDNSVSRLLGNVVEKMLDSSEAE